MSNEQFSTQPRESRPQCPHCGAEHVSARPQRCWLCQAQFGQELKPTDQDEHIRGLMERIVLRDPVRDPVPLVAFGILASVICLGLALTAPGVLILVLILATPALIRTVAVQGSPDGDGLHPVWTFFSSLGVVAIVGIASFAAFFATCFVVCLGGLGIQELTRGQSYDWIWVASVGAGLVPGIAVAVLLFRRFWSRKA